ncbi:MAG: hypothetical protein IKS63_02120 [Firmicutes bacterium]|nr:hypothetical protein [Bacillota bacterium]
MDKRKKLLSILTAILVALAMMPALTALADEQIDINGAKVVLSKTTFTYSGQVQKPSIKTIDGMELTEKTDYTLEWSDENSTNAGEYTITVNGAGMYTGQTTAAYRINPKKVTLSVSKKRFVYNGKTRTVATGNKYYTVRGNKKKYAGKYTARFILKDKANYVWSDGKKTDKKVKWSITKAAQKVKVKKTKYTKFYGAKKFRLKAKRVKGKGKLIYKSSNRKAVKVSSKGVVTIRNVKKTRKVKIRIYAAATKNYKRSPVKTVTIKVYPKQKTPKSYRKYLGKWSDEDFTLNVKVINKNYIHAVMKADDGDYVVIKKFKNTKKRMKFEIFSKRGEDTTIYLKMKCSKPYTQPDGKTYKDGPDYWCTGTSDAWCNGGLELWNNGKLEKVFVTLYRTL